MGTQSTSFVEARQLRRAEFLEFNLSRNSGLPGHCQQVLLGTLPFQHQSAISGHSNSALA